MTCGQCMGWLADMQWGDEWANSKKWTGYLIKYSKLSLEYVHIFLHAFNWKYIAVIILA